MYQEDCHTCDYDQHCDDLQRTAAHLEMEKTHLQEAQEHAEDTVPQLVILENLPKITPASARRETGAKPGTRGDINIGLLNKRGVTVERAAEDIVERYGPDGEDLLPPEFDDYRVRGEIIDILKMGKRNYRAQFLTPVDELEEKIDETKEQYQAECVGDVPEVDLTVISMLKLRAKAIKLKYKYAA